MKQTKLSTFSAKGFDKGASGLKRTLWYFVNALFVNGSWMPLSSPKIAILKLFGAKIGGGIVIKNRVNIKFPWRLSIGNNVWLGEGVWIDNLDFVSIGNDVCISQGAMLLTGNHDFTTSQFAYRNAPITLHDGVWIGARSVVCSGVTAHSHSVLSVASVASARMKRYGVYRGNPAVWVKERVIKQ